MFSFSLNKSPSLERPGEPGAPGAMTLIGLKETGNLGMFLATAGLLNLGKL